MNHYLDIKIRALPELVPEHIMEKLFAKIHLALVELHSSDIAVSFPEMNERRHSLGHCLRLHGEKDSLSSLVQKAGLAGMSDYLFTGEPRPVPEKCAFRRISRVQTKSGVGRLRRRLARRHNLSLEEATARIPDSVAEKTTLPFVRVRSGSSGRFFRLFIRHAPLSDTPIPGKFNAYGLSDTATVPWF
ncbi:MAG: type I-F CRISPR-associated endoribonuclease Cas6/Csy4 [Deltaproteobacteria bacterium]|jgi:CRISPR-associated endonuclease Csy4|nr:type I-F CRISPR-associated endoribonuclease Cas6/Csy4 [Deltaproteobacteria bacterium]